ncbi:MAG: alpha/beta hydrolase [Candidatus Doudnabacteria bacterium]
MSEKVKLHVEDTGGEGRPVILIHGWPLSGKSWKKQISDLKEAGYRVITYDRRGFGESDKPTSGYDYDTFAEDLSGIITELELDDVTIVGFSMGGGEAARYIGKHGEDKLRSVVFAAAVTPMLMKSSENPEGPLDPEKAEEMVKQLTENDEAFYDQFTKQFFSANADGHLLVTEEEREQALMLCKQADKTAALAAMHSFATTDFREDLKKITIPTLVIHGDVDGIVPLVGSADRTHQAIAHSEMHAVKGGPHGINVSHTEEFNKALIDFLDKN